MRKIALFIFSSLLLTACGNLAPDGAVVTGLDDNITTFPRQTAPRTIIFRDLDFVVKDGLDEDAHLLADLDINFIIGGSAFFSDSTGNPLGTPSFISTRTDERGIGTVTLSIINPGCDSTVNKIVNGSVRATVGTASKLWKVIFTVSCATVAATPVTSTPPTISTTTLPNATVGLGYSGLIDVAGGVAPFLWSATNLPPGLVLNTATGIINGIPTTANTFNMVFTVTDSSTPTLSDQGAVSIIVN